MNSVHAIKKNPTVMGAGIDYFKKNPHTFIELIKEDIGLAKKYANYFSEVTPGIFTDILSLTKNPEQVMIAHQPLITTHDDVIRCLIGAPGLIVTYEASRYDDDDSYFNTYHYNKTKLFRTYHNNGARELYDVQITECNAAYTKLIAHPAAVAQAVGDCVSLMLDALIKAPERTLSGEFVPQNSVVNFFSPKNNLFAMLMQLKRYDLVAKVITLTPLNISLRELTEDKYDHHHLMAQVVTALPAANGIIESLFNRMQSMPLEMLKSVLQANAYDILALAALHSEKMPQDLYQLCPAFMESQYPESTDRIKARIKLNQTNVQAPSAPAYSPALLNDWQRQSNPKEEVKIIPQREPESSYSCLLM